tara:strand:- start:990 stop:1406 length:417 start_codon:yes stop_codon:yes gene_type:complete
MEKSEQILQALITICEGLGVGTELDRVLPVNEKECPLFVVRSGVEEMTPPTGARLETCGQYWTMMPQIEFYQAGQAPVEMRAENVRLWSEFREAFFRSPVLGMLAHGTLPDLERNLTSPSANPKISGFFIDMAFTFKR